MLSSRWRVRSRGGSNRLLQGRRRQPARSPRRNCCQRRLRALHRWRCDAVPPSKATIGPHQWQPRGGRCARHPRAGLCARERGGPLCARCARHTAAMKPLVLCMRVHAVSICEACMLTYVYAHVVRVHTGSHTAHHTHTKRAVGSTQPPVKPYGLVVASYRVS